MKVTREHVEGTLGWIMLGALVLGGALVVGEERRQELIAQANPEPEARVVYEVVRFPNGWEGPNGKCNDGWESPSIGAQGACSWHGGVDRKRRATAADGTKWIQWDKRFICKANYSDCLSLAKWQWRPSSVKHRVGVTYE